MRYQSRRVPAWHVICTELIFKPHIRLLFYVKNVTYIGLCHLHINQCLCCHYSEVFLNKSLSKYLTPLISSTGRVIYALYIMSDCYIGLDQQYSICLDVQEANIETQINSEIILDDMEGAELSGTGSDLEAELEAELADMVE